MKKLYTISLLLIAFAIQGHSDPKIKSIMSTLTDGEAKVYIASVASEHSEEKFQIFKEDLDQKKHAVSGKFSKIHIEGVKKNFETGIKRGLDSFYSPIMLIPLTAVAVGWPVLLGQREVIPLALLTLPVDIAILPFNAIGTGIFLLVKEIEKCSVRESFAKLMKMNGKTRKVSKKHFKSFENSLAYL